MTEDMVIEQVRGFIQRNLLYRRPGLVLQPDDRLIDHSILDSMAVMEVIMYLRDRFGVSVPEDDIRETNLGSLRAIAEYVVRARSELAAV